MTNDKVVANFGHKTDAPPTQPPIKLTSSSSHRASVWHFVC